MIELTDNNTCVICLQNISCKPFISICCNTYYHSKCIKKWININTSCPHCRATIENNLYIIPEQNTISIEPDIQENDREQLVIFNNEIINYYIITICIVSEVILIFFFIYTIIYYTQSFKP